MSSPEDSKAATGNIAGILFLGCLVLVGILYLVDQVFCLLGWCSSLALN